MSGMSGLHGAAGTCNLATGHNPRTCVLAHRFIDTFGIIMLYLGPNT